MRIETNFDIGQWEKYFDEKVSKEATMECKDAIIGVIKQRFDRKAGPNNKPWVQGLYTRKDLMQDTGTLKDSFEFINYSDELMVFTKVVYAKVHNYGAKYTTTPKQTYFLWANVFNRSGNLPQHGFAINVPKRQFMGFDKELISEIDNIFIKLAHKSERIGK